MIVQVGVFLNYKKLLVKLINMTALLSAVVLLSNCTFETYRIQGDEVILDNKGKFQQSTPFGNFVTTAIQQSNELDIVLFPSQLLKDNTTVLVKESMSDSEIEEVAQQMPHGPEDQMLVGTMTGEDIKEFIKARSTEQYQVALQTAGIWYGLTFEGGFQRMPNFSWGNGRLEVEDDYIYKIAVSNYFFFSGAFPGYKYRNGFNFTFKNEPELISVRESIRTYLKSKPAFPYWKRLRASVKRRTRGDAGLKTISQIQGHQHISPYYGQTVTTQGVVTAVGSIQWFPYGMDIYIQSTQPDNDPLTSEGLHIFLDGYQHTVSIGDTISLSGTLYEDFRTDHVSQTSLREVTSLTVTGRSPLPQPIHLTRDRQIPIKRISTYNGKLSTKKRLNLNDGIDFWESLEGMRVELPSPRIVGFRGGNEDFEKTRPKGYLNLYVVAKDSLTPQSVTRKGGLTIDVMEQDYNPEIIQISTNHLSQGLNPQFIYNVGDQINGSVTGVLTYQKNIFGGGEYAIVTPELTDSKAIQTFASEHVDKKLKLNNPRCDKNIREEAAKSVRCKPISTVMGEAEKLTVATFNLENLAGHQDRRLTEFARSFTENLHCPDIINLVEIQDFNGIDFSGSSSARETLIKLLESVSLNIQKMKEDEAHPLPENHPCLTVKYRALNIDPEIHSEGGQPGGNIRVSMFYNTVKVGFKYKQAPPQTINYGTFITKSGDLSLNPGRVAPNDHAFHRTRRSLIAQFSYKGEKLFVIGNHLNSKLGDSSYWGDKQPANINSDIRRIAMANELNKFVRQIQLQNPTAHIILLGDFNAHSEEQSMRNLEGDGDLRNLSWDIPKEDRYTTNYNGSSQSLDYIFVNPSLHRQLEHVENVHINSDYMGRLSDHDPVVAKFHF